MQLHTMNSEMDFGFQRILKSEDFPVDSISSEQKDSYSECNYLMGKIHYDKADFKKAEFHFVNALESTALPSESFTALKILGFLIRITSEDLNQEKANEYIAKAEELVEKLRSVLGSLNAEYFYNLGIVDTYKGSFEQAEQNFLFANRKAQEENNPELLAKCLLALATNYYRQKNFTKSLEFIEQLEQLLMIINKSYIKGSMYLMTAKVKLELGLYEEATTKFELAQAELTSKKCWNLQGYILYGKGLILKRQGQFKMAEHLYALALEMIDQQSFKRLTSLLRNEIEDVNDSSVEIILDRVNRVIKEKTIGVIDFKHRFVLLEILFLLARNTGRYFDKEQLSREIWKDEYNPLIHDKLIYTSMSRLRKLIEPKNLVGKRKYIIRGKDGYTFNPRVNIRFTEDSRSEDSQDIANVELSSLV